MHRKRSFGESRFYDFLGSGLVSFKRDDRDRALPETRKALGAVPRNASSISGDRGRGSRGGSALQVVVLKVRRPPPAVDGGLVRCLRLSGQVLDGVDSRQTAGGPVLSALFSVALPFVLVRVPFPCLGSFSLEFMW